MKPITARALSFTSCISVPSTRVYAMKLGERASMFLTSMNFSTLDSGLRDETSARARSRCGVARDFSTLDSGLRDETRRMPTRETFHLSISVPSTRVYAMKLRCFPPAHSTLTNFSTLDSGLRDETTSMKAVVEKHVGFQYPRLGSTR